MPCVSCGGTLEAGFFRRGLSKYDNRMLMLDIITPFAILESILFINFLIKIENRMETVVLDMLQVYGARENGRFTTLKRDRWNDKQPLLPSLNKK